MKTEPFATKLPADLTAQLDSVCKRLGLRKNFALRDAQDFLNGKTSAKLR